MYKPFFYSTYFTVQFSNSGFIFSRESGYISAHSTFGSPCNRFLESRDVGTGVKGVHTPPDFDIQFNSISSRGGQIRSPQKCLPNQIFRPSDIPGVNEMRNECLLRQPPNLSSKRDANWQIYETKRRVYFPSPTRLTLCPFHNSFFRVVSLVHLWADILVLLLCFLCHPTKVWTL